MKTSHKILQAAAIASLGLLIASSTNAQSDNQEITFTKHIAPILQRSCQDCHRVGGVAPMPLETYEQVAPFAGLIEYRTQLRDRAGAMPPWYMEKDIGIQDYKYDPSLSDEELAMISTWVKNRIPEGDPKDMPPPRQFIDDRVWSAGQPDLIVKTKPMTKKANTPDWWGEIESIPTGLTEDRYVASVEIKEVNDVDSTAQDGRETVGGRYIFHHMIWSTKVPDENGNMPDGALAATWPVHEVGRNPDIFDPDGGRLLKAGSYIVSDSVHMHSNGRDTTGHLEIGFRFHPKGYKPKYAPAFIGLGNGVDISITGNETDQELHAYTVLTATPKLQRLNLTYMRRVSACV